MHDLPPDSAPQMLRIGSTHQECRAARSWVAEQLQAAGCDPDFTGEVLLAVGEALTNIVRHAYAEEPGRPIDVSLSAGPFELEIVLEDEAEFFADGRHGQLPDPAELAEGGYGLYLLQTIMDDVRRERRGTTGNRLRLFKQWPAEERKAS